MRTDVLFGEGAAPLPEGADILHVDLDAFYASMEVRARPELAGKPVIVGWAGPRGVVMSCSYEARAFGVRNGMPSVRAKRLCPKAVFVETDFGAYQDASKAFRDVLHEFTPTIEPLSLDEAFCDVSGAHRLHGDSAAIAHRIRKRVREELGITCSVGGGPTKIVAKLASRAAKPDGMRIVTDALAFLHPMPVGDLWGVGEATAQACRSLGIETVGELAAMPRSLLRRELGESSGSMLADLALGIDPRPVTSGADARSVSAENTFDHDLGDEDRIEAEILRLADRVASRLMGSDTTARTITLKIRLENFSTHTRSKTLPTPASDVWTIFRAARDAYASFVRGRQRVRLLGVAASGLGTGPVAQQLTLGGDPPYADAERAVSRVRDRFGKDAVRMGRLVPPPTGAR